MATSAPLVYWGRPPAGRARKACLITNPAAGPLSAKPDWRMVLDPLRRDGWWIAHQTTTGAGSAEHLAREAIRDGCQLIVVAGGDGTLNEALQPVVGTDVALGLIPVGTANILARELGIPLDPAAAARVLLDGHPRPIDVGRVQQPGKPSRYFCEMVGLGFDAAAIGAVMPEMKVALGKGAYVFSAVTASFTHRPSRMRIVVDGKRLRRLAYMFSISNTGLFGADFLKIAPEATVDDGLFHGAIFRGQSFFRAWWEFLAVAAQRLKEWTDVEFLTFSRLEVRTAR
ncbi:MAG: diacylglycerol kinase family lipid kinase, partial [Cyanobacteria bacterium REEB65]|nr:diacylglycerol kinase family lipid kinase [Cyanobacteria bacterium REEB65]